MVDCRAGFDSRSALNIKPIAAERDKTMSAEFITRTFTTVEATMTVMDLETKQPKTVTLTVKNQKDEKQLVKVLTKYCEAHNMVFCCIEDWKTKQERRRMTADKFISESEAY